MDSWKNRFIRWLTPPTARKPFEDVKRILVVSTTALGDTLWATPALSNLRLQYPHAFIAVLTSRTGMQVLQHNPHVNKLFCLKEPLLLHFFSLQKTLKAHRFDVALIFHASQRLLLPLCRWSQIPRIIGTRGINKGLDDLLSDSLPSQNEHEIVRRFNIIEQIGCPISTRTLSYYVQENERQQANEWIGSENRICIAIHPGSKEPFRRWPVRCFAAVGQALQQQLHCEIFLTGSSQELPLLQELQQELPSARIVPSSSIRFLGAFLEQMDLVLSNDTGPFHLALALNRPAVGLYVSTNPDLCGPYLAPRAAVIYRSPTCHPCIKRKCQNPFCFLQISTQEVIEACLKSLYREKFKDREIQTHLKKRDSAEGTKSRAI